MINDADDLSITREEYTLGPTEKFRSKSVVKAKPQLPKIQNIYVFEDNQVIKRETNCYKFDLTKMMDRFFVYTAKEGELRSKNHEELLDM